MKAETLLSMYKSMQDEEKAMNISYLSCVNEEVCTAFILFSISYITNTCYSCILLSLLLDSVLWKSPK